APASAAPTATAEAINGEPSGHGASGSALPQAAALGAEASGPGTEHADSTPTLADAQAQAGYGTEHPSAQFGDCSVAGSHDGASASFDFGTSAFAWTGDMSYGATGDPFTTGAASSLF